MTTIVLIRRIAALGLVAAASARFEAVARGQSVAPAPVVPRVGVGPTVPGTGVGPTAPSPPPPHGYTRSSQAMYGTFTGYGLGGYGFGGYGFSAFGYPGMYGGFGGPAGGFGLSMPPTPELGPGAYRAGNSFPGSAAGMGPGAGSPADPNAPPAGNAGRNAVGGPPEDPFDAAAAAGRTRTPGRGIRSKRAHTGRRPAAAKPARRPSMKAEPRDPDAGPSRTEINGTRDKEPPAPQEKPAAAGAQGAKPAARTPSMLGPPRSRPPAREPEKGTDSP